MSEKPFLTDIKTLRKRARKHMEAGPVTEGYLADRDTVLRMTRFDAALSRCLSDNRLAHQDVSALYDNARRSGRIVSVSLRLGSRQGTDGRISGSCSPVRSALRLNPATSRASSRRY